jgi:disulfide oxidoreductase YuzD
MHILSITVKQKSLQILIANLVLLGLVRLCPTSTHFPSCRFSLLYLTHTLHRRFSKSVLQYTCCKIFDIILTADNRKFINNFV